MRAARKLTFHIAILVCNLLQEAVLIGVDSLGFDLRVCCGTQIQTLRFAFNTRVSGLSIIFSLASLYC